MPHGFILYSVRINTSDGHPINRKRIYGLVLHTPGHPRTLYGGVLKLPLAREIADCLISTHRDHGWRAERESLFSPRRIDVLAIAPQGKQVVAFEIKTSIADFRNELKNPEKRMAVMRNCTQFYFVTPFNLVRPEDIPDDCGLLWYSLHDVDLCFYPKKTIPGVSIPCQIYDARMRDRRLEEIEDEALNGWTFSDAFPFPVWMLPGWRIKPLRFQMDVSATAARYPTARIPEIFIRFDEVPF